MGTRGRPKLPHNLHVIAGTDRPDRPPDVGIELPLAERCPDPPYWLPNAFAVAEWRRLAPILHNNRLLTEAGVSALAVLCSVHGQLVEAWTSGDPERQPPVSLIVAYRGFVNDFGLSPVAQGKVKPSGEAKTTNGFARNGKRPA